jgi:hypothetical protein
MLPRALGLPGWLPPVVASLTLALAVSGCDATSGGDASAGSSGTGTASTAASGPTTTPGDGASHDPSVTPTGPGSSGPSASPSSSSGAARPAGLRGRLLDAAQVPGLGRAPSWVVASTGPEQPSTSFGTCQRFGIVSIGAQRAVVRHFAPAPSTTPSTAPSTTPSRATKAGGSGHDRAGELVATFPDALTARRAYAVLEAWRRTCASRLPGRGHVGDLQEVAAGDRSGWYLLTYGPDARQPHRRIFDAQGMVLRGSRVAMVSLVLAGRDDDPPGPEPIVTTLRRAAQRLG